MLLGGLERVHDVFVGCLLRGEAMESAKVAEIFVPVTASDAGKALDVSLSARVNSVSSGLSAQSSRALPAAEGSANVESFGGGEFTPNYVAVLGSLSALFAKDAGLSLDVKMSAAVAKAGLINGDNLMNRVVAVGDERRAHIAERQEKLLEVKEEQERARSAARRARGWGIVKTVFSFAAAAVAIVGGAALAWTGVGAAMAVAGVSMLAGGLASGTMAVDSTIKMTGGAGVTWDGFGPMMTTIMIIAAILSMGAMMVGGFGTAVTSASGHAASRAASAGGGSVSQATVSGGGSVAASQATTTSLRASSAYVRNFGIAGSSFAAIGGGGGDIGASVVGREAAGYSANAKNFQADAKELSANMELLKELQEYFLSQFSESEKAINAMMAALQRSMDDRGRTMAKVAFSG